LIVHLRTLLTFLLPFVTVAPYLVPVEAVHAQDPGASVEMRTKWYDRLMLIVGRPKGLMPSTSGLPDETVGGADIDALERKGLAKRTTPAYQYYEVVIPAARAGREDVVERGLTALEGSLRTRGFDEGTLQVVFQRFATAAGVLGEAGMIERLATMAALDPKERRRYVSVLAICSGAAQVFGKQGQRQPFEAILARFDADLHPGPPGRRGLDELWADFAQWAAYAGHETLAASALEKVRDPGERVVICGQLLETAIRKNEPKQVDRYFQWFSRELVDGPTRARQYGESLGWKGGGASASVFPGFVGQATARVISGLLGETRRTPYGANPHL